MFPLPSYPSLPQTPMPLPVVPRIVSNRILRLVIMRSGTYNTMVMRPYQIDYDSDARDRLLGLVTQFQKVNIPQSAMASVATEICRPSFQPIGSAHIPNGWETPRCTFVMTVQFEYTTGHSERLYLQGYTDYYGVGSSAALDPNMTFFINSYIKTIQRTHLVGNQAVTSEVTVETGQFINNVLITGSQNQPLYGLRPIDVLSHMQRQDLQSRLGDELQGQLYDHRSRIALPTENRRSNNVPSKLLHSLVESYDTAFSQFQVGNDRSTTLDSAMGYCSENSIQTNPFSRLLSNATGKPHQTSFTLRELIAVDPNATHRDVCKFVQLSPEATRKLPSVGQSHEWYRPDSRSAWASTVLMHAVPSLMLELMMIEISFSVQNGIGTLEPFFLLNGGKDLLGRDMSGAFDIFARRFCHEILRGITCQYQDYFEIHVSFNLYGHARIDIALRDEPLTPYVAPVFCDSNFAPVHTTAQHAASTLAVEATAVLEDLYRAVPPDLLNQ